jgi:preprotein translocase subunit YajC
MNAGPLIFLAALIALLWFVLIRPQRRRQMAHRELIAAVAPNDEVVTAGGIFGKVRSIADDHVLLEIAPGTEVRIAREAITGVVQKDQETAAEPENHG